MLTGAIRVYALDGRSAPDLPNAGVLVRLDAARGHRRREVVLELDDALELMLELHQAHARAFALQANARAERLLEEEPETTELAA